MYIAGCCEDALNPSVSTALLLAPYCCGADISRLQGGRS